MLASQDQKQNQKPRQMGVAGEDDSKKKPTAGPIWAQAKAILAAKAERAAARAARPVPNRIAYAETAFKGWKPGMKIPRCNRCDARLDRHDNHVCPVKLGTEEFKPKYETWSDERKDRLEQRRDEIREVKRDEMCQVPVCSVCGEEIHDYWEDGQIHWDEHEGRPVKAHRAVDAEPDGDVDGYEDEPEEDYCEGDDDGYDCD